MTRKLFTETEVSQLWYLANAVSLEPVKTEELVRIFRSCGRPCRRNVQKVLSYLLDGSHSDSPEVGWFKRALKTCTDNRATVLERKKRLGLSSPVAQRESASLTRKRSTVRSCSGLPRR